MAALLVHWMTPLGYMASRALFAAALFWILQFFLPKEKMAFKDILLTAIGGIMGFILSQYLTSLSLLYTSAVYFSLILALCPVMVMLMAALFLKEPITGRKTVGGIVGVLGAVIIVVHGKSAHGTNDLLGVFIAIASIAAYSIYLIIMRSVSQKYSPVTQMKWMFLVAALILVPLGWKELGKQVLYSSAWDWDGIGELFFSVILATMAGYFMMPYGMKYLRATTVSIYMNMQPVVASVVAILVGQDNFTLDKPIAAILVLVGAYIVTTSKAKTNLKN